MWVDLVVTVVEYDSKNHYGVVLHWGGHQKLLVKGFDGMNKNTVLLQGVIDGLKSITRKDVLISFVSDVEYFMKAIKYKNYEYWYNHGWTKKNGDPLANKQQWQEIRDLIHQFQGVRVRETDGTDVLNIVKEETLKKLKKGA